MTHETKSTLQRVNFVCDRTPFLILRGLWCDVIILYVPAPTVGICDGMKASIYEQMKYKLY
jgi:hypothetical protein